MIKSMTKWKRLRQTIRTIITKNNENDDEKSLSCASDKSTRLILFQFLNYFRFWRLDLWNHDLITFIKESRWD